MTIERAVEEFKNLIEKSIKTGGEKGKEAMIRSSRPILNLHEAVKAELIRCGIPESRLFPRPNQSRPELEFYGFIKKKNQDVCVVPSNVVNEPTQIPEGFLKGKIDAFGPEYTQKSIAINVRSQISSLAKNFDTLYERTFGEAQNLHVRCPKMVLGEVYMIAVPEYNSDLIKTHQVGFCSPNYAAEKYIQSFQFINRRNKVDCDDYKYERVCLLIVDFRQNPAKIYHNDSELVKDKLIPPKSTATIEGLTWTDFCKDLLAEHKKRFG